MSRLIDIDDSRNCYIGMDGEYETWNIDPNVIAEAQPEIVRCKDCKHWKDSDGVYRRGVDAESKCPLNIQEVYAGTFYCGYAERRTDE